MAQYQAEAIVLGVRDWRGADKIVTLFTREYGRVTALAFGLRQPKSPLRGNVQLFSHIDVFMEYGKNLDTLRQCELRDSNRLLREDLTKMAYAALVAEVASGLWPERESQPDVFDMLRQSMQLFRERNARIVALAVCWKLLEFAGYKPEFFHCVLCGCAVTTISAFDPEAGGVVCKSCRQANHVLLNSTSFSLLQRLLTLNLYDPEHFSTSTSAIAENEILLTQFLTYRLDKPLQSLSFIRSLSSLA